MSCRVVFLFGIVIMCLAAMAIVAYFLFQGASIRDSLMVLSTVGFHETGVRVDPRHARLVQGLFIAIVCGFLTVCLAASWYVLSRALLLIYTIARYVISR